MSLFVICEFIVQMILQGINLWILMHEGEDLLKWCGEKPNFVTWAFLTIFGPIFQNFIIPHISERGLIPPFRVSPH